MAIKLTFFYPVILMAVLTASCTKAEPAQDGKPLAVEEEQTQDTTPLRVENDSIGLRLHTMIEWGASDTPWRRVFYGCYDDIIIEAVSGFNETDRYQYLLFDYAQKKAVDTIEIDDSSEPLLFYKSHLPDTLLIENHDGSRRYKYIYGEGISVIEDTEFMSLIKEKYVSEAPQGDAYIVYYTRREHEDPPVVWYDVDVSNLPQAWPEGLKADYLLLDKLNARVFNSVLSKNITRATDWKIWNNRYVFMLSSDENSNPYGHRAYYVVKNLDNSLVFTIPGIRAPYLKHEGYPNGSQHDTLIDFSADQKRVLIKGMWNDKLYIMIYDIVTFGEWEKSDNTAAYLALGGDLTFSPESGERIDAERYNVEPGTTTMYGIMGEIMDHAPLYEEPDGNSRVIMQLDYESMDIFKHYDRDGVFLWEMLCCEIINYTKTIVDGVENYWYQIVFDSAVNWEPPNVHPYNRYNYYWTFLSEVYEEYSGWVYSGNLGRLDVIDNRAAIRIGPYE